MPDPKTYGYGRDMEDIAHPDPTKVPSGTTDNAIKYWSKDDHFTEGEAPDGLGIVTDEIKVHDMSVHSVYNSALRYAIDGAYLDFDFALRDAVATPSKEDPDVSSNENPENENPGFGAE